LGFGVYGFIGFRVLDVPAHPDSDTCTRTQTHSDGGYPHTQIENIQGTCRERSVNIEPKESDTTPAATFREQSENIQRTFSEH
jgi:hypothetical protein